MEVTIKLNDAEFATLKQILGGVSGAVIPAAPTSEAGNPLAVGIEEAAQMLSCAPGTIRKFIRQRRLPRLNGFRHILIPKSAIEKFIKESAKVQ